ncbi:MAG: flagellar biosynthesis protein FlhF [Planctomycetota bacterium]
MKVKTFRAKTMADALAQVKRHLGPEAVILTTRTISRNRLLGLGASSDVEITAAQAPRGFPKLSPRPRVAPKPPIAALTEARDELEVPTTGFENSARTSNSAVLTELGNLRSMVSDLLRESRRTQLGDLPDPLYDCYLTLVRNDVSEQTAKKLVDDARRAMSPENLNLHEAIRDFLATAVQSLLPTGGPIRITNTNQPTVVALVGPTGVGKTTTIAKLAANFCLRDHCKVGLVTIDTYRIAAVDQLRTYADIINVPLEVVMTPAQLRDALQKLSRCDIVLIDTAGRGQRDAIKIKELQRFFSIAKPSEIHLVLSTTTGDSVLMETMDRFKDIGPDRLIFTKLDEAVGFGGMLGCLSRANNRLSYVTTGQDVPDDIAVADAGMLAGRIVNGSSRNATKP